MSYPRENPAAKHDAKSPRLPPPTTSFLDSGDLCFPTTPSLFSALKQPATDRNLKQLATVYSYRDGPTPPLSRELDIVGIASLTLPPIRKTVADDDDVPSCLHKCTLAVRRGDGEHMKALEQKHIINSKTFAQLMQRLRTDQVVAIVGLDKYERFGILKPILLENTSNNMAKYNKEDFFCHCYVGKISEVKDFLRGGYRGSDNAEQESSAMEEDGVPLWKPDDEGSGSNHDADTGTNSGDMWQPPGSDSGGDLWQPPGADQNGFAGGDDSVSWQPPSSGFGDSGSNAWETNGANNGLENGGDNGNKKRKWGETQEQDDNENDKDNNGFHANSGAAAADAFYSGLTRKLDTRADSRLFHMRAFNGWVKATQIQELDPKTPGKKKGLRILDLACGKGGDLGKWVLHNRGIQEYVGSDVARGSLKDAAIRARAMRNRLKHCTFTCADLGHDVPGRLRSPKQTLMQKLLTWSLHEEPDHFSGDPNFQMVRGGGIKPDQMFDVVSIQFAIHYMMQTRQRARRFFSTVASLLEVGGNLIATTIDARVVIDHLMNLGYNLHFDDDNEDSGSKEPAEIRVGAGACRIKFEPETVKKIVQSVSDGTGNCEDLFGLEYTFTLVEGSDHGAGVGDAVNLPEWLTPIPVLVALGKEVGLELEYAQNFHEFFVNRKDPSLFAGAHSSLYSMKVMNRDGSISADEWEISRLYCAVKFRKVREVAVTLEDEDDEMEEADEDEIEIDPQLKMKLMPMAMIKAKKTAGNDSWATLSPDEKTRRTEIELRKLAKASS